MSSFCKADAQHCKDDCCDRQGDCPEISGYTCYYYYTKTQKSSLSIGSIVGIVIGSCVFLTVLGIVIFWLFSKKSQNSQKEEAVNRGQPIPLEMMSNPPSQQEMQQQVEQNAAPQ